MSFFGDVFDFEKFNLKDMAKKIKDDPERLLLGAADPYSSKMWGKILGKDYEPIVDQMGGAYGGHTISAFGNNEGGVYGRAREAGINTAPGGGVHDLAHVLSSMYAGGYGADKLGLGGGGSSGQQGGLNLQDLPRPNMGGGQQNQQMMQQQQMEQQMLAEQLRQRHEEKERQRKEQEQMRLAMLLRGG